MTTQLRFATSWQRVFCCLCKEETNHYKNQCVHCKSHLHSSAVQSASRWNDREMQQSLTPEQRAEARRLLNAGRSIKVIAAMLKVSSATIYRMNPLTRG